MLSCGLINIGILIYYTQDGKKQNIKESIIFHGNISQHLKIFQFKSNQEFE